MFKKTEKNKRLPIAIQLPNLPNKEINLEEKKNPNNPPPFQREFISRPKLYKREEKPIKKKMKPNAWEKKFPKFPFIFFTPIQKKIKGIRKAVIPAPKKR